MALLKKTVSAIMAFAAAGLISMRTVPLLKGQELARPIVYSVPGMDKADVRPDIVYRTDSGAALKMDIAIPAGLAADERRPAVLFIHGGPLGPNFSPGAKDWGVYRSYGRLMAASGLVGVAFNHRYESMKAKDLETSLADVEAAIRFVRENAAAYHIDPERLALWAFSGGGPHLSLGLRGRTPFIRCLVSYYAILDLRPSAPRLGETLQAMEKYSPVTYLTPEIDFLPPVVIGRAGLDSYSINRSVELFISGMLALNGDINLLNHPLGRHGFDIEDDNDQSRDIIAATVAFLKSRLGRPAAFEAKTARVAGELQALVGEGKFEAAREHVRAAMMAPAAKAIADFLITEPRLVIMGNGFLSTDPKAAVEAFTWAVDLDPRSPQAHAGLASGYEAVGRADQAVAEAQKALGLLEGASSLEESRKKAVRDAATALLERLKAKRGAESSLLSSSGRPACRGGV